MRPSPTLLWLAAATFPLSLSLPCPEQDYKSFASTSETERWERDHESAGCKNCTFPRKIARIAGEEARTGPRRSNCSTISPGKECGSMILSNGDSFSSPSFHSNSEK
jgi:hypothetical protein